MKTIFLLLFYCAVYCSAVAQSLVTNGGFEDLDSTCISSLPHTGSKQPYDITLIECILPWGEYSRTHLLFRHPDGAHGGEAIASIQLKDLSKPESHSYVIAPLCSTMVKGAHYKVMFYYRMGSDAEFTGNALSVNFEGKPSGFNNYQAIYANPVYTVPGFIADTGWQKAEFIYEAKGYEQVIMLGNFRTDKETPLKRLRKGASSAYVRCLVDDISVAGIEYPDSCPSLRDKERTLSVQSTLPDTARLYILDKIQFEYNSAELLAAGKNQIEAIALQLEQYSSLNATITGHTDSTGSEIYNKQLSADRAHAVRQALIDLGVPANRLKAVGKGMEQPITHNQTEAARRLNRRVDIRFY
jgi:outer membrane protein OmpA-like peptidoglycan-associated protein